MAQVHFYGYVSNLESQFIRSESRIQSKSGVTYYTTDFYEAAPEAQQKLALDFPPDSRVGPIPADEMPDFDAVPLKSVDPDPLNGQPGGGVEAATTSILRLFAITRLSP